MSLQQELVQFSCGFVFPQSDFRLVFMDVIGYISDNTFYRINMVSRQTEIVKNEKGRSYQAFTTNHKKGLVVLAEYCQNPTLEFNYFHNREMSFKMQGVCQLEIKQVELSLDCKYLLIACGLPDNQIVVVDVQKRMLMKGSNSQVPLHSKGQQPLKIAFNPNNSRHFAVMYAHGTHIYEIQDRFQLPNDSQQVTQTLRITEKTVFPATPGTVLETFIWDEINNVLLLVNQIYVCNGRSISVYSIDVSKEVITWDIEQEEVDGGEQVVSTLILTQKHLIVFYKNGRVEWLNKYYPDLMEQEEADQRPFHLDRYYNIGVPVNYAHYDHNFTKIYVALSNGYFCILPKQAQKREADEDEDQKGELEQQKKSLAERALQIEKELVGPFHTKKIIYIKEIQGSSIALTVSQDGKMIFWSLIQKRPVGSFDMNKQISSVDVNHSSNVLAAGGKDGVLQFYSIANLQQIYLFKQFYLVKGFPLNKVVFSSKSEELAILCSVEKRVFFILTNLSIEFSVLGYCNFAHSLFDICWNQKPKTHTKPRFEFLLISIGYGVLMVNGPSASPTKSRGKELELDCQMYALRTDPDQNLVALLPGGEMLTTGEDKFLKKYKQPEDVISKVDFRSKVPIPPPLQEIDAHDLAAICFNMGTNYFISGSADGSLQFRPYDNLGSVKQIRAHGWKSPSLSVVAGSQVKGLFYSAGTDGSVYVWNVGDGITISHPDKFIKDPVKYPKLQSTGDKGKFFQQIIQENYLQQMKEIINKKKRAQFQKIEKIRKDLQQLLAENQQHEQLDKLERDEFAIDLQSRQKVAQAGQQKRLKIREVSKNTILEREVFRKKLKEITWDRMKVHLKAINGLKSNYIVYNYQIRKRSKQEIRKVHLILELRRLQIREKKNKNLDDSIDPDFHKNRNIVNGGFMPTLILSNYEKKDQKKDDKAKKKKQEENLQKEQQVEQVQTDQEWSILYSAFELYSDNAKRNQIIMMKNIIVKIKEIFNSQFNKLNQFRQNQNQIISDKNKRIIEICEELKRPKEIVITKKNILQNPEVILEVKPEDILLQRYLSRDEREKQEKERLKEEERLRLLAEDDSSQRALQKMMGGTLEEKKTSVLEVIVEREKWMDKPPEQMNEDQKLKLKQYQVKKQKAQQEKERIVKKLQAQLRKLKQEIQDIMEKYDEKLFVLIRRRIQYDYRIEQQELYCAKLSLSMVSVTEENKRKEAIEKRIVTQKSKLLAIQEEREKLAIQQEEITRVRDGKKNALDSKKLGDNDTKVKTAQKSIQDFGKKRRELQEKLLEREPIAKYQLIALDPMHEIESRNLSSEKAKDFSFFIQEIKRNIQQSFGDFPEAGLVQMIETRFNLKKEEAQLDKKLKNIKDSLASSQQKIDEMQRSEQADLQQIDQIIQFLEKSRSDLEVQCRVKQGQVEINNQSPIPSLDDSLLIDKSEIDSKNQKIMTNANEKIKVMEKIKACKISVTEETLNLQRKQELIGQLSSMIKQIQMLKVKKEMQVALAKKDSRVNENQLKSLRSRIEDVRKEGDKRITLFESKIEQINREIESIMKENKQLQVQKYNLQTTVKQRQKIKDMMVGENGEGSQEAVEKFEQISVNRKLFDKAKQQTQEIQLLREELSKLKAKTFANFSNVQR